jgi:hypothetical protein
VTSKPHVRNGEAPDAGLTLLLSKEAIMTTGYAEGKVAREIEQRTKMIPSDVFLWSALASIGLSWGLRAVGREKDSNFVGQWAPTLLILGLYNKLVKLHGSDSMAGRASQTARETFEKATT